MKWTDKEIGAALIEVSNDGILPSNDDLKKAGMGGLCFAVSRTGGYQRWARRLGLKTKGDRTSWNDDLIEAALLIEGERFGRMPSANELRDSGRNDLACAISKHGGYRVWSERLGLSQKGTETHRGQKWERHEAAFFRSLGFEVEEQTARAPFDLLVNGKRVDVKSSSWRDYKGVSGYLFNGIKHGTDCDFFDLLGTGGGHVLHRFVVPATKALCKTLTISPSSISGSGRRKKWYPFKDATHLLR